MLAAKRSFHFELPTHRVFYNVVVRHPYTEILGELIQRIAAMHFEKSEARAASELPGR